METYQEFLNDGMLMGMEKYSSAEGSGGNMIRQHSRPIIACLCRAYSKCRPMSPLEHWDCLSTMHSTAEPPAMPSLLTAQKASLPSPTPRCWPHQPQPLWTHVQWAA